MIWSLAAAAGPNAPGILQPRQTAGIIDSEGCPVKTEQAVAVAGAQPGPIDTAYLAGSQLVGKPLKIGDRNIGTGSPEIVLSRGHRYPEFGNDRAIGVDQGADRLLPVTLRHLALVEPGVHMVR